MESPMIENYKDLLVWQKAVSMAREAYSVASGLPEIERFGLANQLRRAAVSVSINIAEGKQRTSRKEYARFIEIAIGSVNEVEAILTLIGELYKLNPTVNDGLSADIVTIRKMLFGLRNRLRETP
ncbi:MAG: four helix bundle protein [Candidatus Kapabacteria bacterium]|nr:four helix bundle protein [Candidatus Kapabacteria bacterium]